MKGLELPGLHEEMKLVKQYINEFLTQDLKNSKVEEIAGTVLAASGKGYRPRLLLLTARMGEGYPRCRERLCKMGALIEMVHTASLIHDDIVDDSPLRRGCATVQSRFGKDMAVYAGDLILGRVMHTLFRDGMWELGFYLGQTIEDMCRGEIGQLECRYRTDTTAGQYEANIFGKTASLFITACRAGAMESGCEKNILDAMAAFGEHLGYLFQIRDDILDFVSDKTREGKPVHVDFREGIFTLPVLYALENPQYAPLLCTLAGRAAKGILTVEDERSLEHAVEASGGLYAAVKKMRRRCFQAEMQLEALPAGITPKALSGVLRALELPELQEEKKKTAKAV